MSAALPGGAGSRGRERPGRRGPGDRDVRPSSRSSSASTPAGGRSRPGHCQGIRRGARGPDLGRRRSRGRRPLRLHVAAGGRATRMVTSMARVLVVDDDPALLRALRVRFAPQGPRGRDRAYGEQGISQAALTSPDVIVLDLGLPDIDGLTVCRRIRQWDDVPIIVLSAIGSEDRKVAALDEGADDYMTKPFGMAELEARIRTAIRHHRAASEALPTPAITARSAGAGPGAPRGRARRHSGRAHGEGVRVAVVPGSPRRERCALTR